MRRIDIIIKIRIKRNRLGYSNYYGDSKIKYYQPDNQKPLIEQVRINENGKLIILFTEPVLPETINNQNIQLLDVTNQPVAIEFQLDDDKRQLEIAPALTNGSNYTFSVQNVYDLNSNKIDTYTKSFTAQISSIIEDTKPPEIETVYQDSGNLIVKFTEDLKPESINANSIILKRNNNLVEGTTEVLNGRTLKFIPSNSLIENLIYELSIDQSARDLSDKQISQTAITFTYVRDNIQVVFYAKPEQRQEISTTAYSNFHLFQGREYDKELDLYYFRNRYLDPELKIWTTKDPEEYADAYNLYQAFGNNFINYTDAFGRIIDDTQFLAHADGNLKEKYQEAMKLFSEKNWYILSALKSSPYQFSIYYDESDADPNKRGLTEPIFGFMPFIRYLGSTITFYGKKAFKYGDLDEKFYPEAAEYFAKNSKKRKYFFVYEIAHELSHAYYHTTKEGSVVELFTYLSNINKDLIFQKAIYEFKKHKQKDEFTYKDIIDFIKEKFPKDLSIINLLDRIMFKGLPPFSPSLKEIVENYADAEGMNIFYEIFNK